MIRPIMHDPLFLARPSQPATAADLPVAQDLLDTLAANAERCVGMAANMIGVSKRIIVFNAGLAPVVMLNPVVTARSGAYEAEEGCLSLSGVRRVTRYRQIDVSWQDVALKPRSQRFTGYAAQIIQHEVDHLSGILV